MTARAARARRIAIGIALAAWLASPAHAQPAAAPIPPVPPSDDGDGPVRLSLPTEADRTAWLRPGFRLGLGILYGALRGPRTALDTSARGLEIRPGIRFDRDWSIYVSLQYAALDSGARFAASIAPTWHLTPNIAASVGLGYAGLAGFSTFENGSFEPINSPSGQSYTLPDTETLLQDCSGVGVTGVGRIEFGYVLGPRTRTHLAIEAIAQRTGCEQDMGMVNELTGEALVVRQWWNHVGASVLWGIEWR